MGYGASMLGALELGRVLGMMRKAVGGMAALALAGCVSAYKDPAASSTAIATVTFSRHAPLGGPPHA